MNKRKILDALYKRKSKLEREYDNLAHTPCVDQVQTASITAQLDLVNDELNFIETIIDTVLEA